MSSRRPAKLSLEIPFTKYQAVGNDFIVIGRSAVQHAVSKWLDQHPDEQGGPAGIGIDLASMARPICDRHSGVGADGLLLLLRPQSTQHDARMFILNGDGSPAEMSGNGIRCAAAYLLEYGMLAPARSTKSAGRVSSRRTLHIETPAGPRSVRVVKAEKGRWVFRVGMGRPILAPEKIPFKAADPASPVVNYAFEVPSGVFRATVTSMGNPHCSVFVDDFDALDWPAVGREIETSDCFPNRTNVEFVKVLSKKEIEVRFWERGVGKTQSSGTGSCAAAVASILNGMTGRKVRVRTLAGNLEVAWPPHGEVTLTGPVDLVARGTYYWRL